jgi:hypothetical protein
MLMSLQAPDMLGGGPAFHSAPGYAQTESAPPAWMPSSVIGISPVVSSVIPPLKSKPSLPPAIEGAFGWDPHQIELPPLPVYFPRDMIKLELPMNEFNGVLERLPRCIRTLSIQAEYQNTPVSAKLQTFEHVELYLKLWKGEDEIFFIDIQRRKGDCLDANRYMHKLLDAAKGEMPEESMPVDADIAAQQLHNVEALLQKVMATAPAATFMAPQSPEETTRIAMDTVYESLTSKRLDLRKVGLEFLCCCTDLKRTIRATAVPSALVVLQAKPPSAEYASKCQDIQRILLKLLQHREFEDYDAPQDLMDVDSDAEEFIPSDQENSRGRSTYYVEYISEVFHLALTILVNSLEVVACCSDQLDLQDFALDFFQTSQSISTAGIYQTLLDCVQRCDRQLANGYLACKSLRLLAAAHPTIRDRLQHDTQAAAYLGKAVQLGRARHSLLQSESERLWKTLYV